MARSLGLYVSTLAGAAVLISASSAPALDTVKPAAGSRAHAAVLVKAAIPDATDRADNAMAPSTGRDTVTVMIDHAKVVRLPERAQTVIIGNPMIADLTVQKNGIVVVTGKSYGVTNVIALDGSGTLLAESFISVQAATESVVVVQRGLERESYSCTPNCLPSILLGDSNKYFSENGGQAGQRNGLATQR
jgi:Flp pilus assembly secretin CpaC